MKTSLLNFLVLSLVSFSFAANASKTVKSESTMDMQVLTSLADVKFANFSKANIASAKLFQMTYGDGGINSSTAYVIIQGGIDAKGFNIASMISGINRITFSGVGELTVNFTRATITGDGEIVDENRSLKVKFSKLADGTLADTVEIED